MDLMCPLWMMFRASGLSIKIQCKTSRMPARTQKYTNHQAIDTHREKMLISETADGSELYRGAVVRRMKRVPDEDSSLSNLLTSQSRLFENWVQLFLFPRINAAVGDKGRLQ